MKLPISHLFFSFFILLFVQLAYAEFADISRIYRTAPSLGHLEVCQGGGCAKVMVTSLSEQDWTPVAKLFQQPIKSAEQERKKIALAIGLLEKIVGNKIGTAGDFAGTFDNSDYTGQLDCNDEAINSTTYMRLLQQKGYLQFHAIEDMRTRNFFFSGWPHTTAVIRETKTGTRFAVDSWFYDNGEPATVVPFEVWKDNYRPADSPVGKSRNPKRQ